MAVRVDPAADTVLLTQYTVGKYLRRKANPGMLEGHADSSSYSGSQSRKIT